MKIGEIDISALIKAFHKFEEFRKHTETEQERAGVIQAFECCFELCWKTMRRVLLERGREVNSPREAFRVAALENLIEDPEIWFEFLKKRNLSVHTYEESEADKIISICPLFSIELEKFLNKLKSL